MFGMVSKTNAFLRPLPALCAVCLVLFVAPFALADIRAAQDAMEAGDFETSYRELLPAAQSGNATAEELIGIHYAMGLGRERDDERAFDWYLRAAIKGHPGAQSGVGWYYEIGRGMPGPDLVRAYAWYVLSALGGDPDAAISQEEVIKKMNAEEIERGNRLVDDYKPHLFPNRR
jgi:TPR repeat protein